MITGVVTPEREAIIRLPVHGPAGRRLNVQAVIDTGFDGCMSLPPALIAHLRLPWRRRGSALLADGSTIVFDIHEATIVWDRQRLRIAVDSAEADPLVGMTLLDGYELNMQVRTAAPSQSDAFPNGGLQCYSNPTIMNCFSACTGRSCSS